MNKISFIFNNINRNEYGFISADLIKTVDGVPKNKMGTVSFIITNDKMYFKVIGTSIRSVGVTRIYTVEVIQLLLQDFLIAYAANHKLSENQEYDIEGFLNGYNPSISNFVDVIVDNIDK